MPEHRRCESCGRDRDCDVVVMPETETTESEPFNVCGECKEHQRVPAIPEQGQEQR